MTLLASLSPFRIPVFRAIWLASLSSNFGALIQGVGAAWLMTSLTESADLVALVQASSALPIMLFSVISGALADSHDRRRIMLAAQLFMLAVSAALAASAWTGIVTPWLLLSMTFLIGCGTALNNPSWQASVGDIVPRGELPAAVALNSVGFNLTRSVGPAVGGAVVAAAGASAAFLVNAASYLPLIAVIARWRPEVPAATLPRENLRAAVAAGVRYVTMSPNLGRVLARSFVFGFGAISVLALLPLVARDLLGGGALAYGLLLGAFGAGAIGGAFLSGWLRGRLTGERIVRAAFAGFAAAAVATAASRQPVATGAALALAGAGWVLALARFNVTVQLASPRWVVGRTLSLYQTATFGGMAAGSWTWGVVAEQHGVVAALLAAGATLAAGAALGLAAPLPEDATLSLDPLNRFREPVLGLDIKPRSGPILVTIDFEIREEDTAEFLAVMTERRRIRRRDGAQNWTLARDLEHPTRWQESYHVPTWTEYVRHNQRATFADAAIGERLRALHAGEGPPRVRRLIERPTTWSDRAVSPMTGDQFH